MRLFGIAIAIFGLIFAFGGVAEAHGGGHGGGHSPHMSHARVAGHHFAAVRSNRGGQRRGLARAAFVHRLNAERHSSHATRLASREDRREANAKEEHREASAKEEHGEASAKEEGREKASKEEHGEQTARSGEDHGEGDQGGDHGGEGD